MIFFCKKRHEVFVSDIQMMKGSMNHMKQMMVIYAVFGVFCLGCAHQEPAKPTPPVSADVSGRHTPQSAQTQTPQSASSTADSDSPHDPFLDEDLDFLEEEESQETVLVADPIAPWNRLMYHFNDKLYFYVLKPVTGLYKGLVPTFVRTGVKNFFQNITTPIRFVNCLLQGKGHHAGKEMERFIINSTAGGLGFADLAKSHYNLDLSDEDLGQSLGVYGIGNGFYIVWPVLGPSTLRDSAGFLGDRFLNPLAYVSPFYVSVAISAYKTVNDTSFRIGDYETLKEAAIVPYDAIRDAYIQNREHKVSQ